MVSHTINQKLYEAYKYGLERNQEEHHMFGLYTLFAMMLLFIVFGTFWNIYIYSSGRLLGTAVSILSKTSTSDPLKNKSLLVKIPLYIIGTTFVVPFYFLPKLFAELLVESTYKLFDFAMNIFPNMIRLLETIYNFIVNHMIPFTRQIINFVFLRFVDFVTFVYRKIVDAYVELKYFYSIAIFVFTIIKNYVLYLKDVSIDFANRIIVTCISMWNYLLNLFI